VITRRNLEILVSLPGAAQRCGEAATLLHGNDGIVRGVNEEHRGIDQVDQRKR